jgi:hypothetical protein
LKRVLKDDPNVSEKMRTDFEMLLEKSFHKHILVNCLRAIYEKNFEKALSEQILLGELVFDRIKRLFVKLSANLCQKSFLFHQIFCRLIDFTLFLKGRKKKTVVPEECRSIIEKQTSFLFESRC